MNAMTNKQKNRITMVLVFGLFLFPIAASWWSLNFSDYIFKGSKSNHGTLVAPARPLPDQTLVSLDASDQTRPLYGKWSLFYFVVGQCAEECRKILYDLHQIEQLVGKDSLRVQRVILLSRPEKALNVVGQYPGQWLLQLAGQQRDTFLANFRLKDGIDPLAAGRIYLIDPLGNLMMYYPADFDPYGILKDLRRLLKSSQIV